MAQLLPLSGELLYGFCNLNAVKSGLTKLLVFDSESLVHVFKLAYMVHEVIDHLGGAFMLLHEEVLLSILGGFFPLDEGSEHGF